MLDSEHRQNYEAFADNLVELKEIYLKRGFTERETAAILGAYVMASAMPRVPDSVVEMATLQRQLITRELEADD